MNLILQEKKNKSTKTTITKKDGKNQVNCLCLCVRMCVTAP